MPGLWERIVDFVNGDDGPDGWPDPADEPDEEPSHGAEVKPWR